MPFTARPLSAIPKTTTPRKTYDDTEAKALLELVNQTVTVGEGDSATTSPQTATDGVTYPDLKAARNEANKTKRLLMHVLPEGKRVATLLYHPEGDTTGYQFCVYLEDAKPAEEAATAPAEDKPKTGKTKAA